MEKRLTKSRNKVISGVCGGIAEYFNIDPWLVRIVWMLTGVGLIVYIICACCLPEPPYNAPAGENGGYENYSNQNKWQ